ncbi:MAG: DUF1634 domain-containing protein [Halobacteriota archaeon]
MREWEPFFEKTLFVSSAVSISVCLVGIMLLAANPGLYNETAIRPIDLLVGLRSFDPSSITAFGVLLMIASPFVWVGAAIVSFLKKRDVVYSLLSGLVLFMMLLSIVVSFI